MKLSVRTEFVYIGALQSDGFTVYYNEKPWS